MNRGKEWSKQGTIVFDLDGVIATGTVEDVYSDAAGWAYAKCTPIRNVIAWMRRLHKESLKIVIHTARWESDRQVTEEWLNDHEVPYDVLQLGKPFGHIYIDDRSYPEPFLPEHLSEDFDTMSLFERIHRVK